MTPPKYRLLKADELEVLQNKFAYFLSAQSIEAKDWEKIKSEDEKRAIGYLVSFSDFVFEDILTNVQYLVKQSKTFVDTIHCQPSQMVRMRVQTSDPNLDLEHIDLLNQNAYLKSNQLHLSMHEKKYSESGRKYDLFQLMESNYRIADGELYKLLCLMIAE